MLRVLKVGGSALEDPMWTAAWAAAVAAAPGRLVIVHGGGPEITALAARLGLDVEWVDGRRVTTPELLDVASMVLTGRINKRLVGALVGAGVDALGLSGEDGGLLRAGLVAGGRLGRVGVVEEVRVSVLNLLLDSGIVPVISPVSRGPEGTPLNVNADEAAAAVARAIGADELLYITAVEAVLEHGVARAELSAAEAVELVAAGVATGGMALKLEAACAALAAGVATVRIGGLAALADGVGGTRLLPAPAVVA